MSLISTHYSLVSSDVLRCTGADSCADYDTRLRLGPEEHSGLLEVCYAGHWGSVCGGSFNSDAASVVCRQLGYSEDAVVEMGPRYGQGEGPIWLSAVQCTGAEASLRECAHLPPGTGSCVGHSADVNIHCSGSYPIQLIIDPSILL